MGLFSAQFVTKFAPVDGKELGPTSHEGELGKRTGVRYVGVRHVIARPHAAVVSLLQPLVVTFPRPVWVVRIILHGFVVDRIGVVFVWGFVVFVHWKGITGDFLGYILTHSRQ